MIRARQYLPNGELLKVIELIPSKTFEGDLPQVFVNNFVHWLDIDRRTLELRPLESLWTTNANNWHICFPSRGKFLMQKDERTQSLVDLQSRTFSMTFKRLVAIESPENVIMICTRGPTDDQGILSIELPRYRLTFTLDEDNDLQSRNFFGTVIDSDQSFGAFFGLRSHLVLRAKNAGIAQLGCSRHVIIPRGTITPQQGPNHVEIYIGIPADDRVQYLKYDIDTTLGRLVGDGSNFSHFYKILLHAITTSPGCSPDPLTGRTGTQVALNELFGPRSRSFRQLSIEEAVLLHRIGEITASRAWFAKDRSMQQAVWSSSLPPTAQHDGFRLAVDSILAHAKLLEIFNNVQLPQLKSRGPAHLLARAARRAVVFYPPTQIESRSHEDAGVDIHMSPAIDLMVKRGKWSQPRCLPLLVYPFLD